jgi:hypothetical protein
MVYLTQQELDDAKRKVASMTTNLLTIQLRVPGVALTEWGKSQAYRPQKREHSGYTLTFRRKEDSRVWELVTECQIIS